MKQLLFCYKPHAPEMFHSLRNYCAIYGFLRKVSIATLRKTIHGLSKIHTLRITYINCYSYLAMCYYQVNYIYYVIGLWRNITFSMVDRLIFVCRLHHQSIANTITKSMGNSITKSMANSIAKSISVGHSVAISISIAESIIVIFVLIRVP